MNDEQNALILKLDYLKRKQETGVCVQCIVIYLKSQHYAF